MFKSPQGPRNDGSPYVSAAGARAVPDLLTTGETAVDAVVIAPNYLASLRLARSWSQRQIADFAGLEPGTYSRLERGLCEPTLSTAYALAAALGHSVTRIWPPEHNGKRAVFNRRRAAAVAAAAAAVEAPRRRLRDNRHAVPPSSLPPHPVDMLPSVRSISPPQADEEVLSEGVEDC